MVADEVYHQHRPPETDKGKKDVLPRQPAPYDGGQADGDPDRQGQERGYYEEVSGYE